MKVMGPRGLENAKVEMGSRDCSGTAQGVRSQIGSSRYLKRGIFSFQSHTRLRFGAQTILLQESTVRPCQYVIFSTVQRQKGQ